MPPTAHASLGTPRDDPRRAEILTLPKYDLPAGHRSYNLKPGYIWQIDALAHCVCGVRPELDIFARSGMAFTRNYEWKLYDDLASFNCLLMHDFNVMPEVVAAAASHKGLAFFIVPVRPGKAPLIFKKGKTLAKNKPPEPWFDFLLKRKILTFDIPASAFTGLDGKPLAISGGVMAVLAQFGSGGQGGVAMRAKRKERHFKLTETPGWPSGHRLEPIPQMWPISSPLADMRKSVGGVDTAADDNEIVALAHERAKVQLPPPVPTSWPVEFVRSQTLDYPCPVIRAQALMVMDMSLQPFLGKLGISVDQPDCKLPEAEKLALRDIMVKDVSKTFAAGPYPIVPFDWVRVLPFRGAKKNKYDPACNEVRLVSNVSASGHGAASINDLSANPQVMRVHVVGAFLRDMCVWLGPRVSVSLRDIKSCFRGNRNNPLLNPLFVYRVITEKFGVEFFIELCNCFGWRASEWGWSCCLALIEFLCFKAGVRHQYAWVDNFWQFHTSEGDAAAKEARLAEDVFAKINRPLHEQETAVRRFKAQGLIFDLDHPRFGGQVAICPDDKYVAFVGYMEAWSDAASLSVKDLEVAGGVLIWASTVFPMLAVYVGPILRLKTAGKAICKKLKKSTEDTMMSLDDPMHECFRTCRDCFKSWDKVCPLVMGFGPCAGPQVRGWVDACTGSDDGSIPAAAGGVFIDLEAEVPQLLGFCHTFSSDEMDASKRKHRVSANYLELLGIKIWWETFGHHCDARRVLLATDSRVSYEVLRSGFSECGKLQVLVREIRSCVATRFVTKRIRPVVGEFFNQVADLLSRGELCAAKRLAMHLFGLELRVSHV